MVGSAQAPLLDLERGTKHYGSVRAKNIKTNRKTLNVPTRRVTMVSSEGKRQEIEVEPHLPGWLESIGISTPPGGWYGPFGFLRQVQYFFMLLSFCSLVCTLYCVVEEKFNLFMVSVVLVPASLLAAVTAYAHEGLAYHVSVVAEKNEEYSILHDEVQQKLEGMSGVRKKLAGIGGAKGKKMTDLASIVKGMGEVANLEKVTGLVRGFMDAECHNAYYEGKHDAVNQKLEGVDEVAPFIKSIEQTLTTNLERVDLQHLKKAFLKSGVHVTDLALLGGAVCTDSDAERRALMALLYFLINPSSEDCLDEALAEVGDHLEHEDASLQDQDEPKLCKRLRDEILRDKDKFGTPVKLQRELERLQELSETLDRVPSEESRGLVHAVLRKFQADESAEDKVIIEQPGGMESRGMENMLTLW